MTSTVGWFLSYCSPQYPWEPQTALQSQDRCLLVRACQKDAPASPLRTVHVSYARVCSEQACCFREVSEGVFSCPSLGKWSHSITQKASSDEDKGRVLLSHNSDAWRLHPQGTGAVPVHSELLLSLHGFESLVEFKAQNLPLNQHSLI